MSDLITFVTSEALKPLLKKLIEIRRKRRVEIDTIADTFGDPIELAKFYIEPHCQHQNPADFNEEEPISTVRSLIFSTINDFLNRDFAAAGGGKNTMFVLSDAGMGKTTLLVMIKLLNLTEFWPQQFSCKLMKLGQNSLKEITDVANKGRTILLLDSLDEDPLSWANAEERITDILSASANFRRVIITCRTQYFPKTAADPFNRPGRVEIGGYVCPMLFLSYFDEVQVDQYLSKRFPANFINRLKGLHSSQHIQAKSLLSKVRSLQFRPLLLSHIEDLLGSEEANWDDYGVYLALIEAWLLREERKLRTQGLSVDKGHLLEACARVAFTMQKGRHRTIGQDELEELVHSSPNVSYLKDLNFGGRSLLNRNSNGDYRFSHYSIQEFLLAYFVLNNQHRDSLFEISVTDQMLHFILSRLKEFKKVSLAIETKGGTDHVFNQEGVCKNCGMTQGYAAHFIQQFCERSIPSFVFSGLRFDDMDLRNLDLSGLVFRGCSFVNANLAKANLSQCDLTGAVFDRANLSGANLARAHLDGISLKAANIESVQSDRPILKFSR